MALPDYLRVCRLCVLKNASFADIFEVNGTLEIRVVDVINELLELNISPDDGLPNIICCRCLNELARFKRFKNISHEAKTTLECIIKENTNVLPNSSISSSKTGEEKVVEVVDLVEDEGEGESSGAETIVAPSLLSSDDEYNMDFEDTQEDDDCRVVCVPSIVASCDAKETSFSSASRNNRSSSSKTTAVYLPVAKELVRQEEEDAGMILAKDPLDVDEDKFSLGNNPKSDDEILMDVNNALFKFDIMESEIEDPLAVGNESKRCRRTIGYQPSTSKATTAYLPAAKDLVKNGDDNAEIVGAKDPLDVEADNVSSESDPESDDESIINVDNDDEADIVELDIEDPLNADGRNEPEHCSRTLGFVRVSKGATVNAASSDQPMQADKDEGEETCHNSRKATVSASESSDEETSGCEDNVLKCSKCEETFDNYVEFQAHVEKIVCEKHHCDDCLKIFSSEANLKKHKKCCVMSKIYLCKVCKKTFSDALSLKSHVEKIVCEKYHCDDCLKIFSSEGNLKKHKKYCVMSKVYLCKVCKKTFSDALSLKSHEVKHTKEANLHRCVKCDAKFRRKRELQKHMKKCPVPKMSSKETVFYYRCGACKSNYKGYTSFSKHLLGHTGQVTAVCAVCNSDFKSGPLLRKHVSDNHGLLECNFCSKKFLDSYNFNRHILTHSNERPFYCKLCGNNYKTQYSLDVHILSAHRR